MIASNGKCFRRAFYSEEVQMEDKRQWLKNRLLINLGFVPKLFGYSDDHLYRLTQGALKEWTNGVEYYFGITLRGTEEKKERFPRELVSGGLLKAIHAPFSRDAYPYPFARRVKRFGIKTFYRYLRYRILARADGNPWHRLPKAIEIASAIGAKKIIVHASDIVFAPHSKRLCRELDVLARNRRITVCLENTVRYLDEQKRERAEWRLTHHPVKLIEHLKKNHLDAMRITIDTAHLAASGYDVAKMWKQIARFTGGDINGAVSHFHLVDYDAKDDFDAAVPGAGVIGIKTFRSLIDDLYHFRYDGTISIEVAPMYFQNKGKLLWRAVKRMLAPARVDLREEEEYLLKIIQLLM